MTGDYEIVEVEETGLRRAIVLLLLDERDRTRPRLELLAALPGCDGDELDDALSDLEREGVVELTGLEVRASRATRTLDALSLIGI
ncbi:MAG: hypothetical protein ACYCX7_04700 [Solirubrobacteraceae bacterium]